MPTRRLVKSSTSNRGDSIPASRPPSPITWMFGVRPALTRPPKVGDTALPMVAVPTVTPPKPCTSCLFCASAGDGAKANTAAARTNVRITRTLLWLRATAEVCPLAREAGPSLAPCIYATIGHAPRNESRRLTRGHSDPRRPRARAVDLRLRRNGADMARAGVAAAVHRRPRARPETNTVTPGRGRLVGDAEGRDRRLDRVPAPADAVVALRLHGQQGHEFNGFRHADPRTPPARGAAREARVGRGARRRRRDLARHKDVRAAGVQPDLLDHLHDARPAGRSGHLWHLGLGGFNRRRRADPSRGSRPAVAHRARSLCTPLRIPDGDRLSRTALGPRADAVDRRDAALDAVIGDRESGFGGLKAVTLDA